jgi:hypothetical protein
MSHHKAKVSKVPQERFVIPKVLKDCSMKT